MNYNYFVPLIGFSGLIFGIILAKIALEEIRDGLRYFEWFSRIVLAGLIIVLLLSFKNMLHLFIGVVLGYISAMYLKTYFYLGLGSVLSLFFDKGLFFLTNVFVFLYGLPVGSLMRRFKFRELYKSFILFVIPFIFLIFKDFMFNLLIGVSAGGLFYSLVKRRFINL